MDNVTTRFMQKPYLHNLTSGELTFCLLLPVSMAAEFSQSLTEGELAFALHFFSFVQEQYLYSFSSGSTGGAHCWLDVR